MADYNKNREPIVWRTRVDVEGRPCNECVCRVTFLFKKGEFNNCVEVSTIFGDCERFTIISEERKESLTSFFEDACELAKTNLKITEVSYYWDGYDMGWSRWIVDSRKGMRKF